MMYMLYTIEHGNKDGLTTGQCGASMLTFVLFNCTTNKAMVYTDVPARADGSAFVTVPIDLLGTMTFGEDRYFLFSKSP